MFARITFLVADDLALPALDGGRRGVVWAPVTCEGESIVYSSSSSSRSSVSISISSSSTLYDTSLPLSPCVGVCNDSLVSV
jgi:hypothetical protein